MENFNKEQLQNLLNDCHTKADFCRKLGIKPTGGNYRTIDNLIKKFNLDFSHYEGLHWKKGKKVQGTKIRPLSEILVENSSYKSYSYLKERLFKEGLKELKCEICGLSGNEINLELHHINGNPTDNRLENLQILCPNCHSKTENFRGKNINTPIIEHQPASDTILSEEEVETRKEQRKANRRIGRISISKTEQTCAYCGKKFYSSKIQKYCSLECAHKVSSARPNIDLLLKDFSELKSFVQVGNKYGVTDNAVRKWCRLYGIPDHTKELKEYIQNNNTFML